MSDTADAIAPAFTLSQLDTLLAWSAGRPRGFRIAITTVNEWAEETAEIGQREDYIYVLYPTLTGRVHLAMADCSEAWDFATIEEALAGLLLSEEGLETEWLATVR